ncbi:hypothetical protein FLJC2902T_27030 [Flavobacterium limnosediminis JC2902]|uniref:DUF4139 domain-containing protein n=1 Tax=Flavobacterium limnosediminis JC2902 TaxID=1341181 RepID=V6SHR6_9FLAO|nr:hypothetical protein [Flavobacterium limnosediminis]ESU26223.1 hypothetical protein FLJC2902T_27030 [Flavobacterium limnosediminis JC2902]
MRKIALILLLITNTVVAQKTVKVTEQTLKIKPNSTEELLFGFTEGDRIVFTFSEEDGKKLSEVSVAEYPENIKFKVLDAKKAKKEEIVVIHKSAYQFKFKNESAETKTVSVLIQRIPPGEAAANFNTAVKWVTEQDTTWNSLTKEVVAGYDTLRVQKTRKVVTYEKKYEEMVLDKNQRVNAKTTFDSNSSSVYFTLPKNMISESETKKVIAWAYWVGVGKESNDYWQQNRKMIVGAVQGVATYFSTPLGGIAAGAITNLALPSNGEDVEYALVNEENKKLFLEEKPIKSFDFGKGVATFKKFTESNMLQGRYFLMMKNDNYVQPIDVNIKVSAIIEHKKFKEETYTDIQVTPRYGKQIVSEPIITTRKFPATFDYKKK